MATVHWSWGICLWIPLTASGFQCPVDVLQRYTALGGDPERKMVDVTADFSEADFNKATFRGQVVLQRGNKHLFSPKLTYQRDSSLVETEGDTIFGTPDIAVAGADAGYDLQQRIVTIENARYLLNNQDLPATGSAQTAAFDFSKQISTFADLTWSTCPREHPVWSLSAKQLQVNRHTARGSARDVTFRVKGVPIFYLPYFTFSTNDARTTGFLTPSVHFNSGSGIALDIPFYWNIAPNRDATFHLRPMTKRGVMLGAQYRYLGEQQSGTLNATLLPGDRHYDNQRRWSLRGDYTYHFNEQWQADLLFQKVSDLDYVTDFSNTLSLYDKWYLERHATLSGHTDYGNLLLRVQDYEQVSSKVAADNTPYARLPQLKYDKYWRDDGWRYGLSAEAVRFAKSDAVSGRRSSIYGEVAYRWARDFGYLEPKASINAAHYNLTNTNATYSDASFTRILPTLSLDGKLEFERPLNLFGQQWTQTLEPHLFYLYTPYQNQSAAPNFDSSLRLQSWDWLFARNRFIGGDRIGDANQLTTAVTTRFLADNDGQERLRLSLGQIQYFADRRVTLPDKPIRKRGRSDLIAEGVYQIDQHWNLHGQSYWDMDTRQNRRNLIDIRYNLDSDRFAGFSHRYAENDYDQFSLYSVWRFNPHWRGFFRHDYSLRHKSVTNSLAGVEYNDCCWAWRLLGKRYRDDPAAPKLHNALYLEFVFKGLGRLGNGSGAVLTNEISGYRPLAEERSY